MVIKADSRRGFESNKLEVNNRSRKMNGNELQKTKFITNEPPTTDQELRVENKIIEKVESYIYPLVNKHGNIKEQPYF